MDTSPEYVKMCEKAEEIQALRPQVMVGSIQHYYKGVYQYEVDSNGEFRVYQDKFIWLPRQDQLQEMVDKELPHRLAYSFGFFCNPVERISMQKAEFREDEKGNLDLVPLPEVMNQNELDYPKQFTSMEQLWLAFVMKEKYGKIWDSDKRVWN